MNAKVWVPVSVVAVIIAFVAATQLFRKEEKVATVARVQENEASLVREHAPTLGTPGGVVLVEFFDPECESCRVFHPYTKQLLQEFEGKLQIVFRYAPFHHNSRQAIKILEAARMQNKYFETLDVLFEHQPEWGSHHDPKPELMWNFIAKVKGLNVEQVRRDAESPAIEQTIRLDVSDGQALGVRMTPSFFVNGEPLTQFGYDHLRALIEKHMKTP